MKKKILVFVLSFVFIVLSVLTIKLNIYATTASLFEVEAAQVRTSGTAGIRFVGSVDESLDKSDITAYGMILAFGEADTEDLVIGATVNGKSTINSKVSVVTNNNKYYIVLIDIPDTMYGQMITARAYIIKNGNVIYSDSSITRCLSQVLLAAKQEDQTSELIESIYMKLKESYKSHYVDANGNVYLLSSVFETNPKQLEKEFVKDWNRLFGTKWTEITYSALQSSAASGTTSINDNSTDCSGTNFYTFFITNQETKDKWGWLLEYLLSVGYSKVHPNLQINALLNGGTYTYELESGTKISQLWSFKHLSASITNFFNGGSSRDASNDITFYDANVYSEIELYNNKIYSIDPILIHADKTIDLYVLTPEEGYDFAGYRYEDIECYDSFAVVTDSIILEPHYTPIDYSVKFYFGEKKITDLECEYNIESETFKLPNYKESGYIFHGWYTTPTFEAESQVSEIEKGTIGDKVYYAKMEASEFADVKVAFESGLGTWNADTLLKYADILKKGSVTYYLKTNAAGYDAAFGDSNNKDRLYWKYITLENTEDPNIYKIVEIFETSKNGTLEFDKLIAWPNNMTDTNSLESFNYVFENAASFVGGYVITQNVPQSASDSCNITINFIGSEAINQPIETGYIESTNYPTPIKAGYTFKGWYDNAQFNGEKITNINFNADTDITLYACLVEDWETNAIYVGANKEYKTIGAAVAAAKAGQYIVVDPGTYDEDVVITLDDITIFGANRGIAYNGDRITETIISSIAVTGNDFVLDGVTLSAIQGLTINSGNNITIKNCLFGAIPTANAQQMILISGETNNLVVTGCKFEGLNNGLEYTQYRAIQATAIVTNATISNNKFIQYAASNIYIDSIRMAKVAGHIEVIGNYLDWPGGNFTIYFGSSLIGENTLIDINYNVFDGTAKMSGISCRSCPASATVNFIGNTLHNVSGNVFQVHGTGDSDTTTPFTVNFLNNIIADTSSKLDFSGAISNIKVDGNYIFQDVSWTHQTATIKNPAASPNGVLEGITTHKIEFNLNGGTTTATLPTEFVEGANYNLNFATPTKGGYLFVGWYDNAQMTGNRVTSINSKTTNVKLYAKWIFDEHIIGSFADKSWVMIGETILLNAEYYSGYNGTLVWTSIDPTIASVNEAGEVLGLKEGVAEIVVYDSDFNEINFTFYVTVVASDHGGILDLLLESNNENIFVKEDLGVGAGTPSYYVDIYGSVSKLLFTPYSVNKNYYLDNPANKTTLTGGGKGGVDFIVVHYAADMPYSAKYSLTGGMNLASYNKTCNTNGTGASWNYSVGNDGIFYCQNDAYGSWHAGSSKTMTWAASGVTTSQIGTDVYTTDVTLGNDGYFYIKGVKTTIKNTTGYTRLNSMGLGVKVVNGQYYLGGFYYNTSYKYISSKGGNCNSIGMETSVREGSDLWLTWQYTAQLCAQLLIKFELPLNRLVGHHFMSGKDCPQPLLENDLEIWYEFVELTRQQLKLYENYSNYTITMSTNSDYVNRYGRVTSLPEYDECVTYTVTYKVGNTSKTVTLSTILPGTKTK